MSYGFYEQIKNYRTVKNGTCKLFLIENINDFNELNSNTSVENGYIVVRNEDALKNLCGNSYNFLCSDDDYLIYHNHNITIQFNSFSFISEKDNVLFGHMLHINSILSEIDKSDKKFIAITGNSDWILDDHLDRELLEKNKNKILRWYSSNNFIPDEKFSILPMGLENSAAAKNPEHGIGWGERANEKVILLSKKYNVRPIKFLYANFNIQTNVVHRTEIKNICDQLSYVNYSDSNLSYENFINDILDHQAVICPQGNGYYGDNHRIYEVLYLKRIPITFNKMMYDRLHNLFPVILLHDPNQLRDINLMYTLIEQAKKHKNGFFYTDYYYWDNLIYGEVEKLES